MCRDYAGIPVPLETCQLPDDIYQSFYEECKPSQCGQYHIYFTGWSECDAPCAPVMYDGAFSLFTFRTERCFQDVLRATNKNMNTNAATKTRKSSTVRNAVTCWPRPEPFFERAAIRCPVNRLSSCRPIGDPAIAIPGNKPAPSNVNASLKEMKSKRRYATISNSHHPALNAFVSQNRVSTKTRKNQKTIVTSLLVQVRF